MRIEVIDKLHNTDTFMEYAPLFCNPVNGEIIDLASRLEPPPMRLNGIICEPSGELRLFFKKRK